MKHARHAAADVPENNVGVGGGNVDSGTTVGVKLIAVAAILALLLAAVVYIAIARPPFAQPLLAVFNMESSGNSQGSAEGKGDSFGDAGDVVPTADQEAAERAQWIAARPNPYIAKCGELCLSSPIAPADLTGVLFHQASNNYAITLETELPEADYEKTAAERSIRVNNKQESGEWLDADALHLWRTTDQTAMETCIDVGAAAGSVVRAPVTGTVILVRTYVLEGTIDDYEIHIQPDGYADYDCVLIHVTDPVVKAGDHVEGGLTELCRVRDIEKDLTDVQLSFFTPEGVGGNHTHMQVNDASYPGYRTERIPEALKVKS